MEMLEYPENRTSGFRWEIIEQEGIYIIRDEYIPGPSRTLDGQILVGGGGTRRFTINGKGKLVLAYRMPWDLASESDRKIIER